MYQIMHRELLVLITLLLSHSIVAAQSTPTSSHNRIEEYDSHDRRIKIQPKKQREGISKGLIIAYGHPIQPPYFIQWRNGKLYVNEVQVLPSIIDERWWQAHSKPIRPEDISEAAKSLWQTDDEIQSLARKGVPHDRILEFAKKQPHIRQARRYSENALEIIEENGQHVIIELPSPGQNVLSTDEKSARVEDSQRNRIASIEAKLNRGRCVIFVDGGTSEQVITRIFPSSVPLIMENGSLSQEEKLRRLYQLFSFGPAAQDVLVNYIPNEWPQK